MLPTLEKLKAVAVTMILARRGIKVLVGVMIGKLSASGSGVKATLADGASIDVDRVLVATGRRPATADVGLESIGLATDRGFIRVNDKMETSARGYYCIGDANGRCLLAHAASAQGIVAVKNALGYDETFTAPVPNAVYTFPEIASVGITADEAKAKGHQIAVGMFPLSALGKAMAVNATEGFVKVVRDRETGALLGVHMMGHNVTECIAAAGALLHEKVKVSDVAEVVFAHPTIAEAIKESAEDALLEGLHLPPRKVMRITAAM
jgi:dihydrolipoamide dehydrogenase